eukprot:TRINITY_DN10218_c0_g1_i1.p1 TRINITY_DN10218_c0_g1~~TRINITY_DN10218_c0_g1_i1.p1  ORF type:complete len:188 (-),score=15.19 TRINITY_DN10218_c0_g1_i1:118-681(-)
MNLNPYKSYNTPVYTARPAKKSFIPFIVISAWLCIAVTIVKFIIPSAHLAGNWGLHGYGNISIVVASGVCILLQGGTAGYVLWMNSGSRLDQVDYTSVNRVMVLFFFLNIGGIIVFVILYTGDKNSVYNELIQTLLMMSVGYFGFDIAAIVFFLVSLNIYFYYPVSKPSESGYYRVSPYEFSIIYYQ